MTLWTWSQTAASNSNADATINWAEGQAPSSVNNSARALMAAVAKARDDWSGALNTGGSGTAYTVTTNQNLTSLTDGFRITVRMHTASGADPTFAPDGLTAKNILTHTSTAPPSGSLYSGAVYTLTYDSGDDCWYLHDFYNIVPETFDDSTFQIFDNSDNSKIAAFQCSGIATSTTRTFTFPDANGTFLLDGDIGSTVQGYDADTLFADTADNLTAGFTTTPYNAGTQSGGGTYTPNAANGNFQRAVNGGAHTLAPPSTNTYISIQYTNNATAGAITTSGFTRVTGDNFTTTNGDDFMCYIVRNNGISHLSVVAMQ